MCVYICKIARHLICWGFNNNFLNTYSFFYPVPNHAFLHALYKFFYTTIDRRTMNSQNTITICVGRTYPEIYVIYLPPYLPRLAIYRDY